MRRHRIGLALVALVLLIASVFVLMTAGVGDTLHMGLQQASRAQYNRRTNYAAYGMMQMALDRLSTDLNYAIEPAETGTVVNDQELSYELYIKNNYAGAAPVLADDGKEVPRFMVYIRSKSDFRAYPGRYTSTLFSKAYVGGDATDYAVLGTGKVELVDSVVWAWWVKPPGILQPGKSGRITTNGVQTDTLVIGGNPANTSVNCSLKWGRGGDEAQVMAASLPTLSTVWNTSGDSLITKQATTVYQPRVPRFHPPRNPIGAAGNIASFVNMAPGQRLPWSAPGAPINTLAPGDYESLTVWNTTLALTVPTTLPCPPNENKYYFAGNVSIINATIDLVGESGGVPADIYVGEKFEVINSHVNWEHALSRNLPPNPPAPIPINLPTVPAPLAAQVSAEAYEGPRTLRVFFVGSGKPKGYQCNFTATNSSMALHACGKAMEADLKDNSVLWGGLKGFKVKAEKSHIHFQRVW